MTGRGAGVVSGLVLAGGGSRRFGSPKAESAWGVESLLLHACRSISTAVPKWGIAAAEQSLAADLPEAVRTATRVPDVWEDSGPIGGIAGGLERAAASGDGGLLVRAVDLPGVTAPGLLALLARWRSSPSSRNAVVVAGTDGEIQPLAAVWGVEVRGELLRRVEKGERSVRRLLRGLQASGTEVIELSEAELAAVTGSPSPLANVNTPAELEDLSPPLPPIIGVHGWKNSGKTTLAAALIEEFTARGHRVGALKRGHGFDLDHPGTDSHAMTESGAVRTALIGPDSVALMGTHPDGREAGVVEAVSRYFPDVSLVVAEGWKSAPLPCVEARRRTARDTRPIWTPTAPDSDRCLAVVTDCPADDQAHPHTFDTADPSTIRSLADHLSERMLLTPSGAK